MLVEVADLHKSYQTTHAVQGLTFSVQPGEVVGLVGPNGAGKTTTMRCIAGIIPATSGTIAVDGFDIAAQPVKAKGRLAYVPDDPRLFDALTVNEHLEFIASAYRVQDWKPRAEALLTRFQLTDKRKALAGELSRGMRQKVAICCAYLHDPAFIMLDEPLTGLDPRGIREMKDSIRERAAAGAAFFISSHLLALVEDLCTSLLIILGGRQVFAGSIAAARAQFGGPDASASLEDLFFRATEAQPEAAAQPGLHSPDSNSPGGAA
ncbi:MAG: ABC transporter ATP-binding protein [Phycisphaerales bacterium]|nr:ABC transporter ATP-binding protein [Phycisphaerales bacterium]